MDVSALPKGHIVGGAPPTSTSTSGSPLSKRAKKNAKKKANKNKRDDEDEEEDSDKRTKEDKGEDVPENWDDKSGTQSSNGDTPETNPPMTTTADLEPAEKNQQVSPADVERLSNKLDKLELSTSIV